MDMFTCKRNPDFVSGTSYPEQFLFRSLNQIFEAENRKKEPEIGLEFDIKIKELNLRIEYSGDYWHIGREKNDELRRVYCKSRAINYIEIIETQGNIDSKVTSNNLYTRIIIKSDSTFEKKQEKLIKVLDYILRKYGHSINEIDIERSVYEALMFCKRYKYKIIRKDGRIKGTEDNYYTDNYNCMDCIEESLIPEESETVAVEPKKVEKTKNIEQAFDNIEIQKEIEDCTLVDKHKSKMTMKEFNRHCKRVEANWNNW